MQWRKIGIGAAIVLLVFLSATWAMNRFWPRPGDRRPAIAAVPPLAPVTRSSVVIAPVAITLNAIGGALERMAPRDLTGKAELPVLPLITNPDIGWSVTRGPFALSARAEGLTISAALSGSMHAKAQFGGASTDSSARDRAGRSSGRSDAPSGSSGSGGIPGLPGGLSGLLTDLLGGNPAGSGTSSQAERTTEQRADIRGNVVLTTRPTLLPGWRLEPNMTSQVTIADASFSLFGLRLSVPDQVRPVLERAIDENVAILQGQVSNSPFMELEARTQWAKMCRSISLGAVAPGMPNLWLEVRPTRAFAAQPGFDQTSVLLTNGVQAETRIVPSETKPDCPFPAQLEIVPQAEQGRINIAVPIDIPFTEIGRLMETHLKGKVFPEDQAGAFTATIRSVNMAASGDRLLISVGVRANETRSWFGFGADATIHVWGRPMLDRGRQTLRLADVALDVESEAVFGMLGLAARTAVPHLERALAENAVIDLAAVADSARKNIQLAVADFRKRSDGVSVDAEVIDLRLVGIEFDAKTLRVITEADGTVRAVVTRLD